MLCQQPLTNLNPPHPKQQQQSIVSNHSQVCTLKSRRVGLAIGLLSAPAVSNERPPPWFVACSRMSFQNIATHLLIRFLQEDDHEDDHDEDHDDDGGKPWGSIIGASLIVQAATLIGLVVVAIASVYEKRGFSFRNNPTIHALIPSFAAGALIATVVFLVIPESISLIGSGGHENELVEEDHEDHERFFFRRFLNETDEDHEEGHDEHDEEKGSWKFGVFFMIGFLVPLVIGAIFHTADETLEELEEEVKAEKQLLEEEEAPRPIMGDEIQCDDEIQESAKGEEDRSSEAASSVIHVKDLPKVNQQLAASILVGDFLHNFADGIFLGTSFLLCDKSLAWTLAATTVYHELAQEIADFLLLTEFCHFSVVTALFANFTCGLSVLLGALIVAAVDFSDTVVGCILAVSAGVYIYIAVAECIPKMGRHKRPLCLLFFCLGAIPIGLVLLNHTHCEAGHGDEHDEH